MEETETLSVKASSFNYHLALIKIKGTISSLIFVFFIPVGFSGIGLYFAPSGRESRLMKWSFLGFSKAQLEVMHDMPGIILTILFVVHMLLNYRIYINEIKCLVKTRK